MSAFTFPLGTYLLALSVLGFVLAVEATTLSFIVEVRASNCSQVSAPKREFLFTVSVTSVAILSTAIIAILVAIVYGFRAK
jgi:H+/Cl- antiporter ClcA